MNYMKFTVYEYVPYIVYYIHNIRKHTIPYIVCLYFGQKMKLQAVQVLIYSKARFTKHVCKVLPFYKLHPVLSQRYI